MADVIITLPDGRTRRHHLANTVQVLGRDPACEIVLEDSSASRQHACLRCENEQFLLQDLGSKNGTLVNGERVVERVLSHLDEVLVGSVELRFLDESATGGQSSVLVLDDKTAGVATASYIAQDAAFKLSKRRLRMLYDLCERLTTLRDRDALLEDALTICFDMLHFERGAIAVRQSTGRNVDWPVVRNLRGAGGELTISQSILSRALDHGERAIIADSAGGDPSDPTVSMVQHGIRSAMCVPLIYEAEILGVIYGDRVTSGTTYTPEDVDFLAGIAGHVSIGLINARLLEEQKSKLELEAELAVARNIQRQLLPPKLPERSDLCVAALNEPSRLVSGDYYDVVEMSDQRLGFIIADVAGKGVAASLLMSNLQAAVRLTLPECRDLPAVAERWNALIYANTDIGKFVTGLAGIIDLASRTLSFVVAGHPPPYLLFDSPRGLLLPNADPHFPLGIAVPAGYSAHTVELGDTGCTIFGYTDGVTEALNHDLDLFGEERMREVLAQCEDGAPQTVLRMMREALSTFCRDAPQGDDITMLAVRLQPAC